MKTVRDLLVDGSAGDPGTDQQLGEHRQRRGDCGLGWIEGARPASWAAPSSSAVSASLSQARGRPGLLQSYFNHVHQPRPLPGLQDHEQFYTDAACKKLYKDTAAAIIGRVNSINGRCYRDDPTIMGWNLVNEPRCFECYNGELHSWFVEMAAWVKALDPNHLLSLGEEGFYEGRGPNAYANPATAENTLEG